MHETPRVFDSKNIMYFTINKKKLNMHKKPWVFDSIYCVFYKKCKKMHETSR